MCFFAVLVVIMTLEETPDESPSPPPRLIPSTRFILALLVSFAFFIQYEQRVSLSIAIVCMVNKNTGNIERESMPNLVHFDNTTMRSLVKKTPLLFEEKLFRWNELQQQIILGAYWGGYIFSLVPGKNTKHHI
jgi:hypothetical protein